MEKMRKGGRRILWCRRWRVKKKEAWRRMMRNVKNE